MEDVGVLVKLVADAVSAEVAHDGETVLVGMMGDGIADVADKTVGMTGLDADLQTFTRHIHQFLLLRRRLSDDEHTRGVGIISVEDGRHIDVDDVALLQDFVFARDAVAHHLVDARADALRKSLVVERSRNAAMLDGEGVNERIDFFG